MVRRSARPLRSDSRSPSEAFFLAHIKRIADTIGSVARDVGPITFTSAGGECEPFDVVRHLTADRLKEKA